MMRRILFFFFLVPVLSFAQMSQKAKPKVKTATKAAVHPKPADGFVIRGEVQGFPEGTKVELLNGRTGETEITSEVKGNKFEFKGQMNKPDFKIILFNRQAPYITLFLDNSNVKIVGNKQTIDKATITGSQSHTDFEQFNTALEPYQSLFAENAAYDSASSTRAMALIDEFVTSHTSSYITPLAIMRYNQLADDPVRMEHLYNQLTPDIQSSPMGMYIAQQIAEAKKNGVGTVLPDFSQADTSGLMVSLSSLRGKYVLVDFWASWCGPCIAAMPASERMRNTFSKNNIVFIYLSADNNINAWKNACRQHGLAGYPYNYLVIDFSKSVFCKQWHIQSFPHYVLIDKNGKLININAPGPNGGLEALLNKTISQ